MFAFFSYNESLLKNEPGYLCSVASVDKEASKNFVEKSKTYSYAQISQKKANYLNNRKEDNKNVEGNKNKEAEGQEENKERKPRKFREQRGPREPRE